MKVYKIKLAVKNLLSLGLIFLIFLTKSFRLHMTTSSFFPVVRIRQRITEFYSVIIWPLRQRHANTSLLFLRRIGMINPHDHSLEGGYLSSSLSSNLFSLFYTPFQVGFAFSFISTIALALAPFFSLFSSVAYTSYCVDYLLRYTFHEIEIEKEIDRNRDKKIDMGRAAPQKEWGHRRECNRSAKA